MESKRVAIYIRVSTLDQAENGYSLDMQERTLRKWCSERKYTVIDLYADRGISGKDMDHRPEVGRLMRDARQNKFDVVLFWALSRFTRSVSDLYNTMGIFQKYGIDMISYTEQFDTSTPMGRAMVGIVGVFAQLEREIIGERITAAIAERALQGKRTCSAVLGYDKCGKDSFTINQKEAKCVKFYFDSYLKYKNLTEVAALATEAGYKGKRGRSPSPYTVAKILSNPTYCGYNCYHGEIYKGSHEPIIPLDTFNKVQLLLRRQGRNVGRPVKNLPKAIKAPRET